MAAYFIVVPFNTGPFLYGRFIDTSPLFEMIRENLAPVSLPLLFLFILSKVYENFKAWLEEEINKFIDHTTKITEENIY